MGAASLGEGNGFILMSEVSCYGNETRLVDCPHNNLTSSCVHTLDVGVVCFGKCVCVHMCMCIRECETHARLYVEYMDVYGVCGCM